MVPAERLSFFWDNPNYAGAVIACLIPLLWSFVDFLWPHRGRRTWWLLVPTLGAEIILTVGLALTGSRSAVLGVIVSLALFAVMSWRLRAEGPAWSRHVLLASRLVFIAILTAMTPLGARYTKAIQGDDSASNRLVVWRDALALIDANPAGWGAGTTGYHYIQYVQDTDRYLVYGTLVNCYLEIAAAFGVAATGAFLAVLVLPFWSLASGQREYTRTTRSVLVGVVGSVGAFVVTAFFSTVVVVPSLCLLLMTEISVAFSLVARQRKLRAAWDVAWALAVGGVFSAGLWAVAQYEVSTAPWRFEHREGEIVQFTRQEGRADGSHIVFFPDRLTLGAAYGKEIRRAIAYGGDDVSRFSVFPTVSAERRTDAPLVVSFGRTAGTLQITNDQAKILVVGPLGDPPGAAAWAGRCTIVFPEYDELGANEAWRTWAYRNNAAIQIAAGSGQQMMRNFKHILKKWLESGRREEYP